MEVAQVVEKQFKKIGYKTLGTRHKNANGVDLYVTKNGQAFSVEIKKCKITKRRSIQVSPVEKNRKNDDLIAIIHPNGYVLIEDMTDHLKLCTPKGYRTLKNLI